MAKRTHERRRPPCYERRVMRTYQIAVVPGDGIGPEVCAATRLVLDSAFAERLRFVELDAGADCYRRTSVAFPEAR